MLAHGRILTIVSGYLAIKRRLETAALSDLFAQAAQHFGPDEKPSMLGLKDRAGYIVMVVAARAIHFNGDETIICVRVADLNHRPQANRQILIDLFALTRTEAKVAGMILDGDSTAEIAIELGISAETVRSHVKAVLHKFNVGTQAQLVGHALHTLLAADGLSPSAETCK